MYASRFSGFLFTFATICSQAVWPIAGLSNNADVDHHNLVVYSSGGQGRQVKSGEERSTNHVMSILNTGPEQQQHQRQLRSRKRAMVQLPVNSHVDRKLKDIDNEFSTPVKLRNTYNLELPPCSYPSSPSSSSASSSFSTSSSSSSSSSSQSRPYSSSKSSNQRFPYPTFHKLASSSSSSSSLPHKSPCSTAADLPTSNLKISDLPALSRQQRRRRRWSSGRLLGHRLSSSSALRSRRSASVDNFRLYRVAEVFPVNDRRQDLWLLGLFPFAGQWAGGRGQLTAVEMALRDVNRADILPGYRLRMTVNDTRCNSGVGTNAMYDQLYKGPVKFMVLGAGCSTVSEATAIASHIWNVVQLSYSSASPALSNKKIYKKFFRVFPPESSFNEAKFALLKKFNWKKVGLLTEAKDDLFVMTTNNFAQHAGSRGVEILVSENFVHDPASKVKILKEKNARIIIGNFYEENARAVFCEAYRQKMFGPKYVWIITGFFSNNWWEQGDQDDDKRMDCTVSELKQAVKGYFTADANPESLSHKPGISGRTYLEFAKEYTELTEYSNQTAFQESPYGYDSVWAIADMLNRTMQYMKETNYGKRVEQFSYTDDEMSTLFIKHFNETSFAGVSGPVMFDQSGDRQGLTRIEQLQFDKEVRVAIFDPSLPPDQRFSMDKAIIWNGNKIPKDSIKMIYDPVEISIPLVTTMVSLSLLGIMMAGAFLAFNIRLRHRKYIKMSSPNLNNIILAGAMIAYASIIFGGIDSHFVDSHWRLIMCRCYNWTLSLGFSMAFGAMFSKTWRVHKIFTNKKFQRMVIKDYQLMAIVCILVLLDVVVFMTWEIVDPLEIKITNNTKETFTNPYNDNEIITPQLQYCESKHMWYFAGVLYAIKGLLLLFGAFLAFETRKVTVPALNDSKFIGVSLYNVVILCTIGVPVALTMRDEVDASYALISMFIFFATSLTICLVFLPKIIHRNKPTHKGRMWSKYETTNQQSINMPARPATSVVNDFESSDMDKLKTENDQLKRMIEELQKTRSCEECMSMNGVTPLDGSKCHVTSSTVATALTTSGDLEVDPETVRLTDCDAYNNHLNT